MITITGDYAGGLKYPQLLENSIDGGEGDDTIIIYGENAVINGGEGQDSCDVGKNPGQITSCETYL